MTGPVFDIRKEIKSNDDLFGAISIVLDSGRTLSITKVDRPLLKKWQDLNEAVKSAYENKDAEESKEILENVKEKQLAALFDEDVKTFLDMDVRYVGFFFKAVSETLMKQVYGKEDEEKDPLPATADESAS